MSDPPPGRSIPRLDRALTARLESPGHDDLRAAAGPGRPAPPLRRLHGGAPGLYPAGSPGALSHDGRRLAPERPARRLLRIPVPGLSLSRRAQPHVLPSGAQSRADHTDRRRSCPRHGMALCAGSGHGLAPPRIRLRGGAHDHGTARHHESPGGGLGRAREGTILHAPRRRGAPCQEPRCLGFRLGGASGAAWGALALILPGALILLVLSALYFRGDFSPAVAHGLRGVAAAIVGLVFITTGRLVSVSLRSWRAIVIAATVFLLVGVLRVNTALTITLVAPASLWLFRARAGSS